MPAVGRFSAAVGVVTGGAKPKQLHCSDISLFSSLIGYFLDPAKFVEDLEVHVEGPAAKFLQRPKDDADWTAGALLAQKWIQTKPSNPYLASHRTEWMVNWKGYRAHIRGDLERMAEALGGISYEVADVREVVKATKHLKTGFMYVAPAFYKGGYSAMFSDSEQALSWRGAEFEFLEPDGIAPMLNPLLKEPLTVVGYIRGEVVDQFSKWHRLFALESKLYGWTGTTTEYLISNRDLERRRVILREGAGSKPRRFPIYDESEITADSDVRVVRVDRNTALWYRDLFVHKLGSTAAREYFLLLIDGKVIVSFGLSWVEVMRGKQDHVQEIFGISKTSKRYARLGKLYMAIITSGEFKRFLQATENALALREIAGITTTTFTKRYRWDSDLTGMKVLTTDKQKDGTSRYRYGAPFRDDTYRDALVDWLAGHGQKGRS